MNEEKAVGNLREIKEIFDKIGIDYWLDTGTLLGAVRDGRIIEWDTDVDLGTWYGNAKQIASMFAEFEKKGFEICLNERKGNVTTRRSGCDVSFYLYRKRGDYAWTLWYAKGKGIEKMLIWCLYTLSPSLCSKQKEKSIRKSELFLSLLPSKLKQRFIDTIWSLSGKCGCILEVAVPKRHFERLSIIRFYGMEFNIPSDVQEYLEYRYGSNWKIPTRQWTYYKNNGAIV